MGQSYSVFDIDAFCFQSETSSREKRSLQTMEHRRRRRFKCHVNDCLSKDADEVTFNYLKHRKSLDWVCDRMKIFWP